MKPNNPMAQLQQWKANNTKNLVSDKKNREAQKTQQEAQNATKAKRLVNVLPNPLSLKYAQITRQFKLILDSNRKCIEVYPDDFHHKLKMRDECSDLIERLKGGGKLLNSLAKSSDLDQEQTALLDRARHDIGLFLLLPEKRTFHF